MTDGSENSSATGGVAVVIVAAGRGARAGQANGPKQYQNIGGRAVIAHTLEMFLAHPRTGQIVVAIHADDHELFRQAAGTQAQRVTAVIGGPTRQESVRLGLLALKDHAPGQVLIHDAVRPFVDAELIDRTIAAIGENEGALPALPVADTLKRESAAGVVAETVSRSGLHAAQTPQGFPYGPILAAHDRAYQLGKLDFTDDAAIAEWAHIPVNIVPGSPDNVKLTWARDIAMAHQRLSSERTHFPDIRTGNGYDVHAFEPGDHVTLCGVAIPHERGSGRPFRCRCRPACADRRAARRPAAPATSARIFRRPIRSGRVLRRGSSSSTRRKWYAGVAGASPMPTSR